MENAAYQGQAPAKTARQKSKILLAALILNFIAILAAGGYTYYIYAPLPPEPASDTSIKYATIQVGNLERSYLLYIPANCPVNPPLVIVFHGSGDNGNKMRGRTSYEFERLADVHGFVVAYPDGYERHWNDSRIAAPYLANKLDIDDKGFVIAMIEQLQNEVKIDTNRVFAVGYSNGGQMAYRLGLEMPDHIGAIAAVAANLPTKDNSDCRPSGKPIPVLILQGTKDPLNPYNGGKVSYFGFRNRGSVLSTRASAEYFAALNDHTDEPQITQMPHLNSSDPTSVERIEWISPSKADVVMLTVHGGGHVIPQASCEYPRLLGQKTLDISAPAEIWQFFERQ